MAGTKGTGCDEEHKNIQKTHGVDFSELKINLFRVSPVLDANCRKQVTKPCRLMGAPVSLPSRHEPPAILCFITLD